MRALLFIIGMSLLAATAPAQALSDAAGHFDVGNQRYAEGDYVGALDAYGQAEATGYASGALFYNMGNAYYRLDQIGQSIRYYEKARRLLPDDPELLHNLEMAQARTRDTFSRLPQPFWRTPWNALVRATGAVGLYVAGLLLYLLAIGLVGYRIWTGTRNAWHRRVLAASLVAGLLLVGLGYAASLDQAWSRQAVLVDSAEPLRTAPEANAESDLTLHEGVVLDVLRTRDGWAEVRLPNGVTGWIETNALAEV